MSKTKTLILGKSVATAEQMAAYLLSKNPNPKINITAKALAELFIEKGKLEGVRGDLEFARSCWETNHFKFTGVVVPEQNNYCGHGTTSATNKGTYFPDEATGVLAQIQHAKGYATSQPLNCECVDSRYKYVKLGSAPYMEDMGGKWAVPGYDTKTYPSLDAANKACDSYGYKIVNILNKILKTPDNKEDSTMANTSSKTKVIALDAGHGLKTAGKQTPDGVKEWTLNDKVRDKVVALLNGYDVEFIFPDNNEGNTDEALKTRRSAYVSQNADAMVSIHFNAYTGKWNNATGVEVFVDKNSTAADRELANLIYANLPIYMGLKGRGIKKENWTVINQNKIPAVLVEGGFMDSVIDNPVITSDAGQTGYAKAVAEALIKFLDLEKKGVPTETEATQSNNDTTFKVKFLEDMNVRKGAGTIYPKVTIAKMNYVYTITAVKTVKGVLWGKLKSGAGWVCIAEKYCKRV